jgi:hypothetical protein
LFSKTEKKVITVLPEITQTLTLLGFLTPCPLSSPLSLALLAAKLGPIQRSPKRSFRRQQLQSQEHFKTGVFGNCGHTSGHLLCNKAFTMSLISLSLLNNPQSWIYPALSSLDL